MDDLIKALRHCILFKHLSRENITQVLEMVNYQVTTYKREQVIAIEDEECSKLGIVLAGMVEVQKINPAGKTITLTRLKPGDIFGEVIIFLEVHKYPATIVAIENTKIIFLSKEDMLKLCSSNTQVLNNFFVLLSNKILTLNKKINRLSYHTIRQKVCSYLLEEYHTQNSLFLTLPCSRKEMAEQLGIQRPSLSRELAKMQAEGLIWFRRNKIEIKNINSLENCLQEG
jgi:CRP-like cAMP-binding protein